MEVAHTCETFVPTNKIVPLDDLEDKPLWEPHVMQEVEF
jgi:hypothetical protein